MFEKVVESILVEYVSEWVEGLDAEKMKIALFGGKVEVRELKLKTAALDKFQLPLRVKAGTLGRLALKVPWKRLTKESVKLVLEDVVLMVVPAHQDEMQRLKSGKLLDSAEDSYELRMRFAKQQEVRVRELLEKSKIDDARRVSDADDGVGVGVGVGVGANANSPSLAGAGDPTSGWGYREKILHNILDNVSVEIKNIHIRYEDTSQLLAKNPFALGATIQSILVNTTNANGHVTFVDRAQSHTPFVHKILEIVQLGLYCDDTANTQELVTVRRQKPPEQAYVIRPFNLSAKMTVNHDEATSFSIPKLQFGADIGSILASVTEIQCNDVISAINYVSTHEIYLKRIHIRKKRPKTPIRRDARSWWMYAFYGVQILYGLESKKGGARLSGPSMLPKAAKHVMCSWNRFGALWMQRKEYIALHKKMLKAVTKKMPPEALVGDKIRLTDLEDELDVETIVFFRLCAEQELDLEESRHDSVKKLSWKTRWKAGSTEGKGATPSSSSVLRKLDPLERLLLYTTVSEQMTKSSSALAAKEQEKLNSKAILYALDLVVKSFTFALVEPTRPGGTEEPTGPTKEFLRFELDRFMLAIFQRTNACSLTSSIRSIQMLDHSHAIPSGAGNMVPQPLFYSLAPTKPPAAETTTDQSLKFVALSIDASETNLKLNCVFQPFRYIHHLAVASKLQAYFVIQVEVAPELKENAEDALASSSVWINNAVFSRPPPAAAVRAAEKQRQHARSNAVLAPVRVVEFIVTIPVVDMFVLSSDTSPILEAKLTDLNFKSGNAMDTLEFAIDGVEVSFIDGLSATPHVSATTTAAVVMPPLPPNLNPSAAITNSYYDLACRKRSTVLRKARIVFTGEKTNHPGRASCWAMKCTAPPIYFTLSSAQYQQVVQASAAWASSASKQDSHPKLVRQSATTDVGTKVIVKTPHQKTTVHKEADEFDPNDERLCVSVHIPQILIVLEGGGGTPTSDGAAAHEETNHGDGLGIDLVLDLRLINVEAKFTSVAQAVAADFRRLVLFKRKSDRQARHDSNGKKIKLTTAEAISQVNESGPSSRTSSLNEHPEDPEPAFYADTGEPSSKLVEIGQKVTLMASSMDPFKGTLKVQQLILYWDHDLLIALFRSYLWGNSVVAKSAPSSTASSRTSSSNSTSSGQDQEADLSGVASAIDGKRLTPYSFQVSVDKWFIFMRPHGTVSSRFAFKLYGKDLACSVSSLNGTFSEIQVKAKNGAFLESSRFVPPIDDLPGGDDVCELVRIQQIQLAIESAGSGVLAHRTGAATYLSAQASGIELNYVHAHFQVLFDHLNKHIIGFFNWVGIQLQPRGVKAASARTKLDVSVDRIKMLLPRGPVGNATEQERKPERMELDVKRVVIASRPYPKDVKFEQLLIRVDDLQLASFLVDPTREHTDAVASVDESVDRARELEAKNAQYHATVLSKTTILVHQAVYIDLVSVPTTQPKRKNKKSAAQTASKEQTAVLEHVLKPKRPLDLVDVAKEMENYCGFVRVFLSRPTDWDPIIIESLARKPHLNIQAGSCIILAVEKQQIELFTCLLDENFGRLELPPSTAAMKDEDDEKQVLEVQIMIGDVSLGLLRPPKPGARRTRDVNAMEGVAERMVGRIDLEGVHVSMMGFASSRGQQRIVASRARFWKIDAVETQVVDKGQDDRSARTEYHEVECGELYLSSDDSGLQCIDITIDQQGRQAPSAGGHSPPLEVRLHVDTCALLPSFLTLITRLMPFFAVHPIFSGYEKKKGSPVSVSVTTGMVHCMLAQHHTVTLGSEPDADDIPLNLVMSGCAVIRYSDGEDGLKHVQVFGRKMSLEISGQWPPLPENSTSGAVAPSPCCTPTYPVTPRQERGGSMSTTPSSGKLKPKPRVTLAEYRRILCDDFAVDLDLVDTEATDNTMKISTSLTHVHAILCAFDLVMLSKVQVLIDSIAKEASINASSRYNSRTNSQLCGSSLRTASSKPSVDQMTKHTVVNMMLEDVSVTFVREIGEYFSPLARVYSFCMMCNVTVDVPPPSSSVLPHAATTSSPPQTVDLRVFFTDDTDGDLRDDEGLSAWAFNAVLGSWEPIVEPWTFTLALTIQTDGNGKASTKIDIAGSETHSLNANFSPRLLDSFCAIAKELEPLTKEAERQNAIPAASASVISCGFYLANDTGASISYWVSDHTAASSTHSRGFTYASRLKCVPEALLPRHKVPLKLSTAIFPSVPNDQTLSFSWGDEEWHPLTDVRIHSAGKYIYSVLPKAASRTSSRTAFSSASPPPPKVLLALFDISAVFGYRTLTVSSLVRVFNETDVPIVCALLGDDGTSVTEFGVIEPQHACGVPITLIRSIAGLRLLIRPHRPEPFRLAPGELDGGAIEPLSGASLSTTPPTSGQAPVWEKEHRWSNEIFINDKDEATETTAACSLVLDDFDCRCQRMFDGSQPLHVSQICRANGSFFRVWNRVFVASNGNNLKYAQVGVFPTLTFENKCGVPIYVVAFVFKKVRRAGVSQDREYSHIVASEKIAARSSMQLLASSLQESTFCSISMTGFSWSKLFRLPPTFDGAAGASASPRSESFNRGVGGGLSSLVMGASSPTTSVASSLSSASSSSRVGGVNTEEVMCLVEDFKARKASINVTLHSSTSEQCMRRVVIQPRYLIRNETTLQLTFEPSMQVKSRLPGAKTFFSLPSPSFSSKQTTTCCGSPRLEMIHTKLNALHGATTTAAAPASSSSVKTKKPAAGTQGGVASSLDVVDDSEHFYCSETNMISVQIEGNTQATSGVIQFRLDAAVGGTNSTIRLYDESKQHWHDLVVILQQVDAFTTKATFVERYVFLNRTDLQLLVVPACDIMGASSQDPVTRSPLKAHTSTPFHWAFRPTVPSDPAIRVKVSDPSVTGWRWSGKFSLHDVSECAFKLSNKYTSQIQAIRVEVRVESSVRVFIVVSSENSAAYPLYRVINSSAHEIIHFKQSFEGGSGDLSEQAAPSVDYSRGVTQRLFPGESTCFGWDEGFFLQSLDRVLEISYTAEAVHTKVLLDQPGEAQRIELPATMSRPASSVYVHWYLNGVTKTIHVHDTQLPRDKLTGKLNVDDALNTPRGITPVLSEIALELKMPNMMLSILNSVPEEILLFTAANVDVKFASARSQHDEIEVKIGSFQLDNQLSNAVFPVVFTPTPLSVPSNPLNFPTRAPMSPPMSPTSSSTKPPEKSQDAADTFFHMSVFRLCYGDDVDYLKYLSAMVQPARLQVDDFLIISVALLSSDCLHVVHRHYPPNEAPGKSSSAESQNPPRESAWSKPDKRLALAGGAAVDHETMALKKIRASERRMYIETLELHPFKMQVTFQQNNLSKAPLFDDGSANFLLPMVFIVLKSNLVNIDSASINLNALHIYHSFTTKPFMLSAIQQHYAFQGILQMYSLLGSADILGNPLGLVKNLGTGVKDFFYEPMAGMVKSPQEFMFGLSRGTASLVKNSVYGTFNAASKFTGTLSSGIAALSMDGDYINARNTRNRQEVATHIGTGLYYGTKQLGQGIFAGVSGVITAPAMGAYNNGLTGFVEGIGKGLIGVAVKPTAGILDLAARTTAGITATATVFDKKARDSRMRLPRMMHTSDKRLRVYSTDEAMICQLLHRLPQKLLRNEHYEAHVFVPVNRAVVATSHQFFHVDFNSMTGVSTPGHPRITWKFPLSSVWGAQKTAKGVSIFIGSASHVSLTSTTASSHSGPSSPSSSSTHSQPSGLQASTAVVTKSSMTTVLVPMKDSDGATMDRLVKCVSYLVAKQRERAPATDTFASPLPRNSIGMVLEPVRDSNKVAGYEGYGGRVVDVFVGSVCYRAGVEVGDIIVGFGGRKFEAGDHGSALRTQLSTMRKGDMLELLVLRHGAIKHISVVPE